MQTNDETILEAYDKYADAIFRHCQYRIFDRETAKDIMQETFLHLYQYLKKGNQIKYLQSFLYRTANNLIIDNQRKKKEVSLDQMLEQNYNPQISSQKELNDGVDLSLVTAKIEQMNDDYRLPLFMRYVDNLSPKEIAKILNLSENVVSVRIHRGLKKIKREIL